MNNPPTIDPASAATLNSLDAEMAALQQRRDKLNALIALRAEVSDLEVKLMSDSDAGRIVGLIIEETCPLWAVSPSRLLAKSHRRVDCEPRWAIFYVAREVTSLSFKAIGDVFHLNHSTVVYGAESAAELMVQNTTYHQKVTALKAKCADRLATL